MHKNKILVLVRCMRGWGGVHVHRETQMVEHSD